MPVSVYTFVSGLRHTNLREEDEEEDTRSLQFKGAFEPDKEIHIRTEY
jgi:hypothetical protein